MSDKIYPVTKHIAHHALIDAPEYHEWHKKSLENPEQFWDRHGKRIEWFTPYSRVKNTSFVGDVSIRWFEDGQTNVSYNCIDRHLETNGDQVAIIWEGDDPSVDRQITYSELHEHVCRMANVLKKHGVKRGDRVTVYMPMIPEAAYAMLACTRIGAIHSVVFGGFSPDALAGRIVNCQSTFVITCDEGLRGGKQVALKANVDSAVEIAGRSRVMVKNVLVVRRTGKSVNWAPGRDLWHHEEIETVSTDCPPEPMNAEDPLFILYTSGSTGSPKGVQGTADGNLCIADSWPGQARTVYGDHARFIQTYFSTYEGKYFTGDGCRRDEDGYYWITGRVDDVLNVSGHRLGTAEVESALVSHQLVSEAAVVGYPHNIKGQGIYCYVTLIAGGEGSEELRQQLVRHVRAEIGPIASPDRIQFAPGLPKTRSGKIMRRILRKIAEDDFGSLGDTSTLADPGVVDDLITNRQNRAETT